MRTDKDMGGAVSRQSLENFSLHIHWISGLGNRDVMNTAIGIRPYWLMILSSMDAFSFSWWQLQHTMAH